MSFSLNKIKLNYLKRQFDFQEIYSLGKWTEFYLFTFSLKQWWDYNSN
jgi:hypothetical protein